MIDVSRLTLSQSKLCVIQQHRLAYDTRQVNGDDQHTSSVVDASQDKKTEGLELGAVDKLLVGIFVFR